MVVQNVQNTAQQVVPAIEQTTVQVILLATTVILVGLLVLIGIFVWRTEGALDYANFFVVIFGILVALIGFLVAFPLLVSGVFADPTQVLALLSALFGTIVGLVGTFFGIKTSSDARQDAQQLASSAISTDTTPPSVSSVTPLPGAVGVSPNVAVTATFTKDMDPATINDTTFKLAEEANRTPVAGRVEYDSHTNGAIFRPRNALTASTAYRVTITTDIKDRAGNALPQEDSWEFTVAP